MRMQAQPAGTPDWIRTSGLQSRSLTRYPTAPRARTERYEIFSLPAIRENSSQTVVSRQRFSLPMRPRRCLQGLAPYLSRIGQKRRSLTRYPTAPRAHTIYAIYYGGNRRGPFLHASLASIAEFPRSVKRFVKIFLVVLIYY